MQLRTQQKPSDGKEIQECNCPGHTGLAVFYRFPNFILERYIMMVMQMTYIDGPEFLLRVPRVLPWTHLLWRYSVCGDLQALKRMYSNRTASPYDVDPSGRNALVYASRQENVDVAHFLLDAGTQGDQPDNMGNSPSDSLLRRSFGGVYGESGNALVRRLLNEDDSKSEFGFKRLHKIVLGFLQQDMAALLDLTNNETIESTDSLGRTALFWAVIRDNVSHVDLLLSHGAQANAQDVQGFTPIDFVRGAAVCTSLVAAGATINVNADNCYHSSLHEHVLETGCSEVISIFHSLDSDIDPLDHDDETPLLNAIYAGNVPAVRRLLELGANPNQANYSSNDSALHFAAHFDRPEILRLLLSYNADYNAVECNGRNLAHCAALKASTAFLEVLADSAFDLEGLDLGVRDWHGRTAGEYILEREVLSDCEVGVHEAWADFVGAVERLRVREEVLGPLADCEQVAMPGREDDEGGAESVEDFSEGDDDEDGFSAGGNRELEDSLKMPGAFPVLSIQAQLREIGVGVAAAA